MKQKLLIALLILSLTVNAVLVVVLILMWPAAVMEMPEGVIGVGLGDMLLVKSPDGTAVIDVTKCDINRATYRWRYKPRSTEESLHGQGVVFEKVVVADGKQMVNSQASETIAEVGPFLLEWSYGSRSLSWFYYDPETMEATVLPDDRFDCYPLE